MGGACSTYRGQERRIKGFGKMDLQEVGAWVGSNWLRIGAGGGHL